MDATVPIIIGALAGSALTYSLLVLPLKEKFSEILKANALLKNPPAKSLSDQVDEALISVLEPIRGAWSGSIQHQARRLIRAHLENNKKISSRESLRHIANASVIALKEDIQKGDLDIDRMCEATPQEISKVYEIDLMRQLWAIEHLCRAYELPGDADAVAKARNLGLDYLKQQIKDARGGPEYTTFTS